MGISADVGSSGGVYNLEVLTDKILHKEVDSDARELAELVKGESFNIGLIRCALVRELQVVIREYATGRHTGHYQPLPGDSEHITYLVGEATLTLAGVNCEVGEERVYQVLRADLIIKLLRNALQIIATPKKVRIAVLQNLPESVTCDDGRTIDLRVNYGL